MHNTLQVTRARFALAGAVTSQLYFFSVWRPAVSSQKMNYTTHLIICFVELHPATRLELATS